MFMDYELKGNQLIITVDLEEEELLGLKKSKSGKSYSVLFDRLSFDFKGYPIKGNLNLFINKDEYEEIMSVKKLAVQQSNQSNSNTDSSTDSSNIETRIDKLEDAVSQLTSGLNQLITLLNSNSKK